MASLPNGQGKADSNGPITMEDIGLSTPTELPTTTGTVAIITPTETVEGAASVAMGTDVSTNQIPESLPVTKRKGDKLQLIPGAKGRGLQSAQSSQDSGTEVSPLQNANSQSRLTPTGHRSPPKKETGLKVIIISSVVFAISITIALILTIYFGPPQVPPHGAVATSVSECSDIGTDMLKRGGAAVDAAIAAMFCISVMHGHNSGIGGGGMMVLHEHKTQRSTYIDFRETAPSGATKDMFNKNYHQAMRSAQAAGVPGELRGMEAAWKLQGKIAWKELVKPSIALALQGFRITKELEYRLKFVNATNLSSSLRELFFPRGKALTSKDTIKRPDLAQTLEIIANEGAPTFYEGFLAKNFVSEVNRHGGVMTEADMRSYKVRTGTPISTTFGGATILVPPAPSGGPVLLNILNMLDAYKFKMEDFQSNLTYHRFIEVVKMGYAQKGLLGDPAYEPDVQKVVDAMLNKTVALETIELINDNSTLPSVKDYGPHFKAPSDKGTTHISVIGPNEDMVSVTTTINYIFGSGFMTTDGIIVNNEMGDFSRPNEEQVSGVPPGKYNFITPGKRPLSSVSPAILYQVKPCGPRLAIGGTNGSHITSGVAEAIMNVVLFKQGIDKAIESPRAHNQLYPNIVYIDPSMPALTESDLRARGHQIVREVEGINVVNGVLKVNETVYAHSDSRKFGQASVF